MKQNSRTRRSPKAEVPRRPSWLFILSLAAIGTLAYINSFDVPLVFDDLVSIQKNANVRFGDYFTGSLLWSRSLLYLTFTTNYYFGGQEVWGYHLINLVFHLLNGFLVFLIGQSIFSKIVPDDTRCKVYAFFAAGFFLVHPIQTESVTYISSRSELVSTFFYAIGVLVFVRRPAEKIGFVLSGFLIVILLLALGGKETAITLPAVLFLYDFIFLSGSSFRSVSSRWRFYGTFFALAAFAAYYIATRVLQGSIGHLPGHLHPWNYFLTQFGVIVRYIRLLVFPVGLNLDHDIPGSTTILDPTVIASLAILSGLVGLGWYWRKRQPLFSFAIFWFFITLAPTSSFVPILDLMFEHRLYLPMLGVALALPLAVERLLTFCKTKFPVRVSMAQACLALLIVLTTLSIMRNHVWRDEVTLWSDVVRKSPQKARPYNALSMAYYKIGDYGKALEINRQALAANPEKADAFYETMGNMHLKLGNYSDASDTFRKVVEVKPSAMAYNNLGVSYLYMWDRLKQQKGTISQDEFMRKKDHILENASHAFKKSIELDANLFWAADSYVNVMFDRGLADVLEQEAEERLQTDKDDFASVYVLGKLRFLKNDFPGSTPYFDRAVKLNSSHKIVFFNFGYALTQIGDLDAAEQKYIQAIRIDPLFIEAYHNLGLVQYRKKDLRTSATNFLEVLRHEPKHISSNLYLARIRLQEGNRALAREHLQTILGVSPGHKDAVALLQQVGS